MKKSKYNPTGNDDLSKGKMLQRAGYLKGTFIEELEKVAEIMLNGGQAELKAQEVRVMKDGTQVQVLECRIYYVQLK